MTNLQAVVLGKSGSGKSVFTRWFLADYRRRYRSKRIIVLDDSDEHGQKLPFLDRLTLDPQTQPQALNWPRLLRDHPCLAIETVRFTDQETAALLDTLAGYVWEDGHTLLAVDEGHNFFPRVNYSEDYARLWRGGRKRGIDLLLTTQMVVDLNIIALKQANVLVSFQLTEENELQKVGPYFTTMHGQRPEAVLPMLGLGDYLLKDMQSGRQTRDSTNRLQGIKRML